MRYLFMNNLKITKPFILKIVFAVLVIVLMWFMYVSCLHDPYNKEIEWTSISLQLIRENIQKFKQTNQRYPVSLDELNNHIKNDEKNLFHKRDNKEFISDRNGCSEEHVILDGKGGWFYNKQTGEIKININKPLKTFFEKYYYLPSRNKIPSEW